MFNCVECEKPSFGCNVFVLISYCFLGEIRRYFLTAAPIAYSNQFFFLLCSSISDRPPCSVENSDLHMVQNTFSTCQSSFINGYSGFRFSVKVHFLFGIFVGFIFPTVHTSECSRYYSDYTPHKLNRQCDSRQQENWTSISKRKEIINNVNIKDNWKLVHYLKIHMHCVGSWYLKDR
jgi:hypothetical protein